MSGLKKHETPAHTPDLTGVKPGSPEEKSALETFREKQRELQGDYHHEVVEGLAHVATKDAVVRPEDSSEVHVAAREAVTSEVPVVKAEHPIAVSDEGTPQTVAVHHDDHTSVSV